MNDQFQSPWQVTFLRIHSYIERVERFFKRQIETLDSKTGFFKTELNRK